MTSHPKDTSDELISVMKKHTPKIAPFFHLPLQSGSNRILKEMNRTYTRERYLEIATSLRKNIPGIALSTDVIIGFPTESDDDFADTMAHARHIFFFLPPEQIDSSLPRPEENVCFDIMSLNQSLATHLSFPDRRKIKSLTYIVNKVDKLRGRPNTESLFNAITATTEVSVYNSGNWNMPAYAEVDNNARQYILSQNPALYNILNSMTASGSVQIEKYFIPVAPYGYDAEKEETKAEGESTGNVVIHRGFLAGLPYLRILKTDGLI